MIIEISMMMKEIHSCEIKGGNCGADRRSQRCVTVAGALGIREGLRRGGVEGVKGRGDGSKEGGGRKLLVRF